METAEKAIVPMNGRSGTTTFGVTSATPRPFSTRADRPLPCRRRQVSTAGSRVAVAQHATPRRRPVQAVLRPQLEVGHLDLQHVPRRRAIDVDGSGQDVRGPTLAGLARA